MLVTERVGSRSHRPEQAGGWEEITRNHPISRYLTCHSMCPALGTQLDEERTWAPVRLDDLSLQTHSLFPGEAGLCFFDIRVFSVNFMFFYLINGARVLKFFEEKKFSQESGGVAISGSCGLRPQSRFSQSQGLGSHSSSSCDPPGGEGGIQPHSVLISF